MSSVERIDTSQRFDQQKVPDGQLERFGKGHDAVQL